MNLVSLRDFLNPLSCLLSELKKFPCKTECRNVYLLLEYPMLYAILKDMFHSKTNAEIQLPFTAFYLLFKTLCLAPTVRVLERRVSGHKAIQPEMPSLGPY